MHGLSSGTFFVDGKGEIRHFPDLPGRSSREQLHNPNFKRIEFDAFKNEAGSNSFTLTPKKWIETTNAIGIISKAGRYGGTYAHKDIAFEFASWISPAFKFYLIIEYQRLKEAESNQYNLEWNVKRMLAKANYHIHTDAIKEHIIPDINYSKNTEWMVYAEEAEDIAQETYIKAFKNLDAFRENHLSKPGHSVLLSIWLKIISEQNKNGERTSRILGKNLTKAMNMYCRKK